MKCTLKVFSLVLFALLIFAQTNYAAVSKKRFSVDGVSAPVAEKVESEKTESAAPVQDSHIFCLTSGFADQQKVLRENIAKKISAMKNGKSSVIWAFLAICFLYGMLHALGPGHGKSIVVGYFLARNGRWRHGVALGAGITFAHTLSAVVLLLVLYAVLKATVFPTFEVGRQGMEKVSYGLVCFTGLLLVAVAVHDLVKLLKQKRLESKVNRSFCEEHKEKQSSWKELVAVAAVTGIVPCPAVALIVLFCLLNSMIGLALVAAAVICVGMTLTNVLFGVAAVALKKGINRGASKMGGMAAYIHIMASFGGGLVVFCAGMFMLTA